MAIKKVKIQNFTVFDELSIDFIEGINVLIGPNGTGKTHIMKALYSACQATRKDISFAHKLVKVFRPDDLNISRLVKRRAGNNTAYLEVNSDNASISLTFSNKTKKWQAEENGEERWEKQLEDLTSTFIPAKEILSNAWNLEAAVDRNNVDFDDTYIDIVTSAKVDITVGKDSSNRKEYLEILQKITKGKVTVEKEKFYLKPGSHAKIEFHLVAEGIRKLALLWQLIKNGTLEKGSILFWDEPEANINPEHIPLIVELLIKLQQNGVQIFISTHDYIFAKYFEVKRNELSQVHFYSLYEGADKTIQCEDNQYFKDIKENAIRKAYDQLLDEVFDKNLGD